MDEERVILTKEEAIEMLPEGEYIHTFRNSSFVLIGADINRGDVIKAIQEYEVELSGSMATNMGHGMVLVDNHGALFIETKKEEE